MNVMQWTFVLLLYLRLTSRPDLRWWWICIPLAAQLIHGKNAAKRKEKSS